MSYRLKRSKPLAHDVRRVAVEQLERAIKRLSSEQDTTRAVHETRKHLKRARALLRLVRYALPPGTYKAENARLRDIGRSLSRTRDLHVLGETLAKLDARHPIGASAPARALSTCIAAAWADAEAAAGGEPDAATLKSLEAARRALKRLDLEADGFAALGPGIEATYRRCRRAHEAAQQQRSDESFHELRKCIQQHWRQLALISDAWPALIKARTQAARDLSDVLGLDQDLARLVAFADAQPRDRLAAGERRIIKRLAAEWQKELRTIAAPMITRLLAEKPRALVRTLAVLWVTAPPPEIEIAKPAKPHRKGTNGAAAPHRPESASAGEKPAKPAAGPRPRGSGTA